MFIKHDKYSNIKYCFIHREFVPMYIYANDIKKYELPNDCEIAKLCQEKLDDPNKYSTRDMISPLAKIILPKKLANMCNDNGVYIYAHGKIFIYIYDYAFYNVDYILNSEHIIITLIKATKNLYEYC